MIELVDEKTLKKIAMPGEATTVVSMPAPGLKAGPEGAVALLGDALRLGPLVFDTM